MRVHVDTDFAGDPDDACAVAMLLGRPEVRVVAATTTADPDGVRAGYLRRFLGMLGAGAVPVAVGAGRSLTTGGAMGGLPDSGRYWAGVPEPERAKIRAGEALDLLAGSVAAGATVLAIGPYTNLAALERLRPGALATAPVVTMGGWVHPFPEGYPRWGPDRDHNVSGDVQAALELFSSKAALTLVPCASAVEATLRTADLRRLAASGPVGALLARQSLAHRDDHRYADLARAHRLLPDDLVNFHWDPVTAAVATGWRGARTADLRLAPVVEDGMLRFVADPHGRRTRVVTGVDGAAFTRLWLEAVERAQAGGGHQAAGA